MVAFNFQPQFVEAIASGAKTQTIRRTARAKVGDRLQLYTGMRTKACRKIVSPDPVCTVSNYIALRPNGITFGTLADRYPDADDFARLDGFLDYADMHRWFTERYETEYFVGQLIQWGPA